MPAQFPDIQLGDAVQGAAEFQMYRTLRGYGWVSGDAASPVAGATQVEIDSAASVWIDGTEVDVSNTANTADITPHGDYPRWATIVVEDDGNVAAVMGEVNKPARTRDGTRVTGREAPRPQPPIITDPTQVVYAFVWVPANASEIDAEHVVDRRVDARVDAYNLTLDEYTDAEAIAAAEAEDPFDHAGVVNVGGTLDVSGTADFGDDLHIDSAIEKAAADGEPIALRTHDGGGTLQDRLTISAGVDSATATFGPIDNVFYQAGSNQMYFRLEAGSDQDAIQAFAPNGSTVSWQLRAFADTDDSFAFVEQTSGNTVRILELTDSSVAVDGDASFTHDGDDVLSSSDGDYDIQKDGTDGTGVINFKTS